MISKSDIVILVLASSALAFGVYRWHQNTQDVSSITIPANSRVVIDEPTLNNPVTGTTRVIDGTAILSEDIATSVNSGQSQQVQTQTQVIQPTVVTEIVTTETATPVTTTSSNNASIGIHDVRSGDSLSRIAQLYGTDVDTLRNLNGISGSVIQVGQEIRYPQ